VPPGAAYSLTVKYVPSVVGMASCNAYRVKTLGGNEISFSCTGQAIGFNVFLSVKTVHFGEVNLGNQTNRLLNICNDSEVPTSF
jgi:hypothetical protein